MKNKLYLAAVVLAAIAMFNGCSQEGPVGPQGPPGVQGPVGPSGNATVIPTDTFSAMWTLVGNTFLDSLTDPNITSDIVNNGAVQVFIQYGSEWWALPDINAIGSGVTNTTLFGFGVGYLKLSNIDSDGSIPPPPYPPANLFRYIIISSSAMIKHPYVNWRNYNQVKAALNIKD